MRRRLFGRLSDLHAELQELNCRLVARWIRSASNPSDFWTRLQWRSDWQLCPRLRTLLFERWGAPMKEHAEAERWYYQELVRVGGGSEYNSGS